MELDFEKMNGLIPAIIQDNYTQKVLMLGFMNKEAYEKTMETGKVTFFSRTKNRLWTKGEESGNFLHVVSVKLTATTTHCSSWYIRKVLSATRVQILAGETRMSRTSCS